jgi:site-specific recombinase XerD
MPTHDDDSVTADGSESVGDRVRIFCRGRIWHANFQDGGKQHRTSLKTASKKEARRRALKIEGELLDGRWKAEPATATVEQAVLAYSDFLLTEGRAAKTVSKYDKVFEQVAALAQQRKVKDLSGINLKFADAYRRMRMDDGAGAKTRYTETVILRQLVNFALSRDMIGTDPLKGLRLKKPRPAPQPCWTYEQVRQILAASPEEIKPALTLLAETGMRFAEMAWLTWDDIEPTANILRIRPKEGWKPKTGDQRAVPMNPVIRQVLWSLPRRWRWVVTMPPSKQHPQPGRQWTERRLLAALKRVLKGLQLPGKLHTFRHTFISDALLKGTPVAVVREWVGHVDDEVIKLYTHVHDGASQAAMQRLSEANSGLLKTANANDEAGRGSAQSQHSVKEARNDRDAK